MDNFIDKRHLYSYVIIIKILLYNYGYVCVMFCAKCGMLMKCLLIVRLNFIECIFVVHVIVFDVKPG